MARSDRIDKTKITVMTGITLEDLTKKLEPVFAAKTPFVVGVTSGGRGYSILQKGTHPKTEKGRLEGINDPYKVLEAVRLKAARNYNALEVETTDNGTKYQSFVPNPEQL